MAFKERFELVVDVITGQSTTGGLKKLTSDLGETEGAFGKLKVAGKSALTFVSDNIAGFATAAAAAFAAFAVSSVKEFSEVALGAGKLRDALGVTADEASRIQEVAGDLGIGVGTLESSIGFMNKTLGKTPQLFKDLGVEIARNRDGTTDVLRTYENVATRLAAIKDPAERATVATQLLGRGWKESAELIMQGGDGIERALEGVSKQQIVSDKQIQQARDLRDNLDDLGDKVDQAKISLGSQLVPAVNDALDAFESLADVISPVIEEVLRLESSSNAVESALGTAAKHIIAPWTQVSDTLGLARDVISGTSDDIKGKLDPAVTAAGNAADHSTDQTDALAAVILQMGVEAAKANTKVYTLGDSTKRLEERTRQLDQAWSDMKGELDDQQVFIDLQSQFDAVRQKGQEAWYANASGAADAEQQARDYQSSVIDLKRQVIDFASAANDVPKSVVTRINAEIDRGDINRAEQELAILSRNRTANISVVARQAPGYVSLTGPQARASGGPVRKGEPYWVGEEGPELVVPDSSGTVIPNGTTVGSGSMSTGTSTTSGGNVYNLHVTAPLGSNEKELGRILHKALVSYRETGGGRKGLG